MDVLELTEHFTKRPVWAQIDLDAAAYNMQHIRQAVGPDTLITSVVKANAYGHGAVELAKVFISSGEFLWNSGIFVWRADSIRAEMERYLPEVTRLFRGWENAIGSPVEDMFIEKAYSDCIKISIDYGVMEKTAKAWLYPARFRWADVGTWESLYNIVNVKDKDGNVFNAKHVLSKDNSGSLVISENKDKLLAVSGLEDFIVIDTEDALLICPRSDKRVKDFTSGLAMPGYEQFK